MLPHDLCAALAAAEAGVDREEDEHVCKAQRIVDDKRAAVVADEIGTVGGNKVREEAEEADGGVVGDDLDHVHENSGQIIEELCNHTVLAAGHLNAEAEEDSGYDERQDSLTAPQLAEVGLGKEIDDHVGYAQGRADLSLNDGVVTGNDGEEANDDVHDDRRYCGGGKKGSDGDAHYPSRTSCAGHICDSRCYRAENHGNDDAEHEVYENRSDGLKDGSSPGDDLA